MLLNPFTPTEIASQPDDFFGRRQELTTLERSLAKGSVTIQGPMGIGKSSLMARTLLQMEGFESENAARSVIVVGSKDLRTLDDAARCLLQKLVTVDQRQNKLKFAFGSFVEFESTELVETFREQHHLSVLTRMLRREYLDRILEANRLLILAIDECEKCPVPLAQLVRAIVTQTQQHSVRGVRFVLTGVSPFFQRMLSEDQGITRFFTRTWYCNRSNRAKLNIC